MLDLPRISKRQFVSIQVATGGILGFVMGMTYGIGGFLIDLTTTGLNVGSLMALGAIVIMPAAGMLLGLFIGVLIIPLWGILYRADTGNEQMESDDDDGL